ncbi:MAG: hypothetical protein NTY19_49805 [Planctomycetota bacterium]|nr:hypothetical protein [Planctomycetota bacterium]
MNALRWYRGTQILWLSLVAGGVLIAFIVRAPEGTSVDRILHDATLTGRVEQLVAETKHAVDTLAKQFPTVSPEELAGYRVQVKSVAAAADRLRKELDQQSSSWIPVDEANELLQRAEELSRDAWERTQPPSPEAADAVDTPTPGAETDADAALDHTPAEVAKLLHARVLQLDRQATQLRTRIEHAVLEGMLARGTFLGLETWQWLLGALVVSGLLGTGVLQHAAWRLRLPPEKLLRVELELIGRSDRRAAVQACQERVRDLLDLADSLCRGGRT